MARLAKLISARSLRASFMGRCATCVFLTKSSWMPRFTRWSGPTARISIRLRCMIGLLILLRSAAPWSTGARRTRLRRKRLSTRPRRPPYSRNPRNRCGLNMVKFRKTVLSVLFGLFAACLIFSFGLYLYFYSALPTAPDQQAGRIHKMDIGHGFIRYGSEKQFQVLETDKNTVFPLSFIPFLLAAALGLRWKLIGIRR